MTTNSMTFMGADVFFCGFFPVFWLFRYFGSSLDFLLLTINTPFNLVTWWH